MTRGRAHDAGLRRRALGKEGLPGWLDPVVHAVETVEPLQLSRFLPPEDGAGRQSAVLILFGEGERRPRAAAHGARQLAPLARRASRPSPAAPSTPRTATRRATVRCGPPCARPRRRPGSTRSGVQLFGVLPKLYIPVSGFVVTPVLGWWREPTPVGAVDPNETARVFTVPVADLTDPANRATAVHPSGHRGPAFLVESALVWGFTAGVIDRLLHYAGWERPWDREKQVPLDWRA